MNNSNPKADFFFNKSTPWKEAYETLRSIILECDLTEEVKWGCPCYTLEGRNVVLIHGFKQYCALLLMKGALLKDPKKILVQQTENVQSGRQIRFTAVGEIVKLKAVLKAYVREAMEVEKSGAKVEMKKSPEPVPEELQAQFDARPALKAAFKALTPGRQRGYILHISGAKQSTTRAARVAKWIPQILDGKGMDDE